MNAKNILSLLLAFATLLLASSLLAQPVPELLYYQFDGTGTSVPNLASAPPAGTATATIQGTITQGGTTGLCNTGTLNGSNTTATTDYLNTGFTTSLSGSWTISFWSAGFNSTAALYYIFGDVNAGGFRCFTNGVAGPNNWILRGTGITDVTIAGGATAAPHVNTFVYDAVAGNIQAYLDGVLVNTVAQTAITISGTGPFKVMGYSSNIGAPIGGQLDEFRLYNRALSAAEVAQLVVLVPMVTTEPVAAAVCANSDTAFSVAASNTSTYQWQENQGSGFVNLPVGGVYSGVNDDTLHITGAPASMNGYQYRCVIVGGCLTVNDTSAAVTLTVNAAPATTQNVTVCAGGSVTVGNSTYTQSGTYTDVFTAVSGCDSTVTTNLTVLQVTASSQTLTLCAGQSVTVGNSTYTQSGTYTDVLTSAAGCDSTVTTNLTVLQAIASSQTLTLCAGQSVTVGNSTYTQSGTYTDVLTAASGCDSTVTTNLTVSPAITSTQTLALCAGGSVVVGNNTYTQSGTYTDVLTAASGCDSTVTTNLTVAAAINAATSVEADTITASESGASYQWINCADNTPIQGATSQAYTAMQNGNYAVIVTVGNCSDTSACVAMTSVSTQPAVDMALMTVYPNPFSTEAVIQLRSGLGTVAISVENAIGQTVQYLPAVSGDVIISRNNLSAGIYFVRLIQADKVLETRKLMIAD